MLLFCTLYSIRFSNARCTFELIARMRQEQHTRPIKLFHRYPGRQSGHFGADRAPLRNRRKKRNRTAPTSIIFRSFVVERIGCGANRSIGGQSWVAQRVNFGPCAVRREISVVPRQGIHLSSGRYNWSC